MLLGLFCLIPLLNFPRALLTDRALFLRDIGTVWAPQTDAVARQVARGEFPWFDAKRGFGQPLFADPRAEVLYPPSWMHWLLPPGSSYAWFCAFHLVVAAMGASALARKLVPGATFPALAVAGFAFAAGGPMLSLVSHWHHLAAAAWMPWILERAETRPGEPPPWLALSSLVALQILAGSPDYTLATVALVVVRLITRSDRSPRERVKLLLPLGIGLGLSAVQLLPTLAFARDAAREALPVGWSISPLHPLLTVETVLPVRIESWPLKLAMWVDLVGGAPAWMFSHYLGLSIWVLAWRGLFRAGWTGRSFAATAVVVGVVLSWGVRDETLQWLLSQIPVVSQMRFPTKHLVLASLGLALLSARGALPGPDIARFGRFLTLFLAAFVLVTIGIFVWSTERSVPFEPRSLGAPLLAVAAFFGMFAVIRGPAAITRLAPLLVAVDLLGAHVSLNPTTPAALFRDRPPLTSEIPRESRLYVSDYTMQTRDALVRAPASAPYALARAPQGFSHAESLALAATWYLNPPVASRFGYFGSFDLDILDFYRRPLKTVVDRFVTSRDPDFVLRSLQQGAVDFVVTMDPPQMWEALPLVLQENRFFKAPVRLHAVPDPWPRARFERADGSLEAGRPRILEMTDGRIRAEAAPPSATRLVIAIANCRGWRATVDGVETAVLDNQLSFITVPLEAGSHIVELSYRPPLLSAGIGLSALSLATVLLLSYRGRPLPRQSP
jgi:hypothetical protein